VGYGVRVSPPTGGRVLCPSPECFFLIFYSKYAISVKKCVQAKGG